MKMIALVAVAGLAGTAMADFNTGIQAGPFISDGAAGAAANGVYTFSYTGATANYNSVRIRGTATYGGIGSWSSELRWRLTGLAGAATRDSTQFAGTTNGTWAGGLAIDSTNTVTSFQLVNGNSYSFRFWESFDDSGGADATWSNVQFDLGAVPPPPPPPNTFIGTYTAGAFNINTFGGNFDTEIGLFDNYGVLLNTNDDAGGTLQSQVSPTLAAGTYYLAVAGFNSSFGAGTFGASGGTASGLFDINVNGFLAEDNQTLASGTVRWFSFDVVPTPGTMSLAGLAGLVALRRRR